MSTLVFYGQFTTSGSGATGLTVTADVTRVTRSDGTQAAAATAQQATEVTTPTARGVYLYRLTGADLNTYDYVGTFVTAGTADLKHVPALWSRFSESLVGSQIPDATAGAAGGLFIAGSNAATTVNITGSLSGSVGSVTAGVALSATGLDAIAVTDPGAPASHTTLAKMLVAVWRFLFKKQTLTSTQQKFFADDGTTANGTATVSDDLTTQTRGAFS